MFPQAGSRHIAFAAGDSQFGPKTSPYFVFCKNHPSAAVHRPSCILEPLGANHLDLLNPSARSDNFSQPYLEVICNFTFSPLIDPERDLR
mmetsp:Transcript_21166/g.23955  ORF Transcript_21166/g.23955 Transcript_21166/m.23955 type:complete len:90 (+) Transcript_21166:585-854(+)